jgi:hypothetical protein
MSDEYTDSEPIRINFTGVQGQRSFNLLPAGKYIGAVTDFTEDFASDNAANPGARMINWEFTLESTVNGDTEVTSKVKDQETKTTNEEVIKVEGRRVFDNMVIVEGSFWRIKSFLDAMWFDTEAEIELWPDEIVEDGTRLILQIGVQRAKKNRKTGEEYKARNRIVSFHPLAEEKPAQDTPSPVVAETSDEDEKQEQAKPKAKAKEKSDKEEEAKV